eukprot:COSAG01_NODE_6054_length_3878_cov_4.373379_2_plen_80_part_00
MLVLMLLYCWQRRRLELAADDSHAPGGEAATTPTAAVRLAGASPVAQCTVYSQRAYIGAAPRTISRILAGTGSTLNLMR